MANYAYVDADSISTATAGADNIDQACSALEMPRPFSAAPHINHQNILH
jgi:hypothetical protein